MSAARAHFRSTTESQPRKRDLLHRRAKSDAERALATSIVDDHWRLNRTRAIEENIFDPG
jgi:hypothetical protein